MSLKEQIEGDIKKAMLEKKKDDLRAHESYQVNDSVRTN
jgi:uncharacterized protein YqeY